jgi:hypothetical protein
MGLRDALRLVDDARPGPEVVLDALAGEPVPAVEEDHAAGGDGLAGLGVDLDAVGFQAHVPLLDLDVALSEEEPLAVQVLNAVSVHGDRGPGLQGEPLTLLAPGQGREKGERDGDHEPDEARSGHGPPPRRCHLSPVPPRVHRRSDAELGNAGILSEAPPTTQRLERRSGPASAPPGLNPAV